MTAPDGVSGMASKRWWAPATLEIDFTRPLSSNVKEEFRRAFFQSHLVVIRGGIVDFETQSELAETIAPVLGAPDSMMFISNARSDGYLGAAELAFHSDVFFGPDPYHGASLHAVDVVAGASSTRFANATRAYQLLPDRLRERLAGLEARHISGELNLRGRNHMTDLPDDWPQVIRPILWEHPTLGAKTLAVNYGQTDCIIGMTPAESEALLEELFTYLYNPDNIYEHFWTNGDLVYWDNLALQHARGEVSKVGARTLQRISFGGKPYREQCPTRAEAFENLNEMTRQSLAAS